MSPTYAEITVGLVAAVLVFLFALRVTPLIIEWLAHFYRQSTDDRPSDHERKHNTHER
ncbi:MAG: hypothetical protein NVS4B8_24260 [Herpetosiphon sp.]